MECVSSLQNICEVKIAIVIANHKDIKNTIISPEFCKGSRDFKELNFSLGCIVDGILKKISLDIVNKISKYLITYVAIRVSKWATFYHSNFDLPFKYLNDFLKVSHFTLKGHVNEEKTARELINRSRISLFIQYKIACHYYLDDIIPVLWKRLRHKPKFKRKLRAQNHADPVVLWSEYLEEKEKVKPASLLIYAIESFLAEAFCVSLDKGNIAGIKYCWRAMTPSKRIVNSLQYSMLVNSGEKYVSVHDCDWLTKLNYYSDISYFDQLLLSDSFEKVIEILEFFLKELKKGECKDFLISYTTFHEILYYLLRWPYQHLFLRVVDYAFEVRAQGELCHYFSGEDFFSILHNIVDLSRDPNFCRTYNYSYLLKELWDRTPSDFKDLVIDIEIGNESPPIIKDTGTPQKDLSSYYILEKLVLHSNVTSENEYVFRSILEHANPKNKMLLFRTKGYYIGPRLAQSGHFRLIDIFVDLLNLEEETVAVFKKGILRNVFITVLETENIALGEEYIKFAVKPQETDEFKKQIFSKVFELLKILDIILDFEVSVAFLNRIFKMFFSTNEELEYWKSNIIFDQDFAEFFLRRHDKGCSQRLDVFFEFLGYSKGKIQDVKREILIKAMPYIILKLVEKYAFGYDYGSCFENRILYFCLFSKERIKEFTNFIYTYCQDYVELEMCVLCRSSTEVYELKSKLLCKIHHMIIMSPEDIKKICSTLTDNLTSLLEAREVAKKRLKTTHLENKICQGLCKIEVVKGCDNCKK